MQLCFVLLAWNHPKFTTLLFSENQDITGATLLSLKPSDWFFSDNGFILNSCLSQLFSLKYSNSICIGYHHLYSSIIFLPLILCIYLQCFYTSFQQKACKNIPKHLHFKVFFTTYLLFSSFNRICLSSQTSVIILVASGSQNSYNWLALGTVEDIR